MRFLIDAAWWRAALTSPSDARRWLMPLSLALPAIIADVLARTGSLPDLPATSSIGIETYAVGMFLITMAVWVAWLSIFGRLVIFAIRRRESSTAYRVGLGCAAYFAAWVPLVYVATSFHMRTASALIAQQSYAAYVMVVVWVLVLAITLTVRRLRRRRTATSA